MGGAPRTWRPKKVVVQGNGDSPEPGVLVLFNWKGRVVQADDTSGYDYAERSRVTTRIGDGDEIPGLELTLRHMREGEKCLIRCESRFAYGPDGCPPTRPGDKNVLPDANIEILVELLEVLSTTPLSEMTVEEKVAEGQRKKAIGNDKFARTAYKQALRSYTSACNVIADVALPNEESEVLRQARQLRIDCGNNIATTCVRLGELEKAKDATVDVLELDPDNTKALFRAGQVSSLQSNFVEAKLALRRALDLNPESKEIQAELRRLLMRIKAYNAKKQTMQEAMGRSLLAANQKGNGTINSRGDSSGTPVPALESTKTEAETAARSVTSRHSGGASAAVTWIFGCCRSLSGYIFVAVLACVVAYFLSQIAPTR